jgi:hypothetical protein
VFVVKTKPLDERVARRAGQSEELELPPAFLDLDQHDVEHLAVGLDEELVTRCDPLIHARGVSLLIPYRNCPLIGFCSSFIKSR